MSQLRQRAARHIARSILGVQWQVARIRICFAAAKEGITKDQMYQTMDDKKTTRGKV